MRLSPLEGRGCSCWEGSLRGWGLVGFVNLEDPRDRTEDQMQASRLDLISGVQGLALNSGRLGKV
jgi:hypothetical protein